MSNPIPLFPPFVLAGKFPPVGGGALPIGDVVVTVTSVDVVVDTQTVVVTVEPDDFIVEAPE